MCQTLGSGAKLDEIESLPSNNALFIFSPSYYVPKKNRKQLRADSEKGWDALRDGDKVLSQALRRCIVAELETKLGSTFFHSDPGPDCLLHSPSTGSHHSGEL
jgi:hypothetical protein